MTKKFWNDWQKRIGETDQIYLDSPEWWAVLDPRDQILHADFDQDSVQLTINKYCRKLCGFNIHSYCETVKETYNRTDIKTIKFKHMKEQRNFDENTSMMMFSREDYLNWEEMASDLQIVSEIVLEHNWSFLVTTVEYELTEIIEDLFDEFIETIEDTYYKVVMTQIENGGIKLEFVGENPLTKLIYPWDEC